MAQAISPLNVLIIDDEQHLCELFTDILARENLVVKSANTAKDGLALLADNPDDFGVVFSDIKLPDMNGIEVLKEIKRRVPELPVVMVTGHANKETAVEAMRLGAYDYLSKPFNVDDVTTIAQRAMELGIAKLTPW